MAMKLEHMPGKVISMAITMTKVTLALGNAAQYVRELNLPCKQEQAFLQTDINCIILHC